MQMTDARLHPCLVCHCKYHGAAGSFGQDMGLTPSQDALLNLGPPSQPDHGGDPGAGNGASAEQAQPDAQVLASTARVRVAGPGRAFCDTNEHCIKHFSCAGSRQGSNHSGVTLSICPFACGRLIHTAVAVCQGRPQEGSLVSLMGQQADGGSGNVGGTTAAANGGEQHLSLPGASAASAFQAVQPVQQSEHLERSQIHRAWCCLARAECDHHCSTTGAEQAPFDHVLSPYPPATRPQLVDAAPLTRCPPSPEDTVLNQRLGVLRHPGVEAARGARVHARDRGGSRAGQPPGRWQYGRPAVTVAGGQQVRRNRNHSLQSKTMPPSHWGLRLLQFSSYAALPPTCTHRTSSYVLDVGCAWQLTA